jgi:hypothetical protein
MMILRLPAQWASFFHGLAAGDPLAGDRPRSFPASQPARTAGPFGRFVDESQKRIPLRLLDIAIEKVDPAIGMINADQSLGAIEGTDA